MMGIGGVDDDNYDDDILDNAEKFIVCQHKILNTLCWISLNAEGSIILKDQFHSSQTTKVQKKTTKLCNLNQTYALWLNS